MTLVVLAVVQTLALLVLLRRLAPGRNRKPAVAPQLEERADTSLSVLIPSLNEARRIGPCLAGLKVQGLPLTEILVIDSNSSDGTSQLVSKAAERDTRIRLLSDGDLPAGWVGKVWALQKGLESATGEWVLGIDADTVPQPGMVGAVLSVAERNGYDVVSFSPRFAGQTACERLVQPAMLVSLVYRTGAAGSDQPPDRVLANGQCFLARRRLLLEHGGYAAARNSFSDDVTLARHLARNGLRVGFEDGSRVIHVRAYSGLREMWREWGRSFDLSDSSSLGQRWGDVLLVWLVQALPLPILTAVVLQSVYHTSNRVFVLPSLLFGWLFFVNLMAFFVRLSMLLAMQGSYVKRGLPYWLSWLSDIPAALRLSASMLRARAAQRVWRGRRYVQRGDGNV